MKKMLLGLIFVFAAWPAFAQAPAAVNGCVYNLSAPTLSNNARTAFQCDINGQLKIGGTINATSAGTATAAAPTYVEGTSNPFSMDLSGNLRTSASLTGATSNAGSAVATSGTNVPTVAYTYGFNGTTWDQLQVTAAKSLKQDVTSIAGTATATGSGTMNNGTQRMALATDSPGIIATGTAGSPSATVLTIQGVTSMTKLLVTPDSVALPANQSVNLAQVAGTNTVNGGVAGSQSVGGTVATNVAITANPLNLGAQGVSSENFAITTARQVQLVADLVGKLIVLPYANPENFVTGTTAAMTGTASTSLVASPGGSLRNYITQISCVNSHATVGTFVTVQDGSGGTALATLAAAAVYGGETISFPTPLRQPTTATALFVADVTTGANVICSATGYKGL